MMGTSPSKSDEMKGSYLGSYNVPRSQFSIVSIVRQRPFSSLQSFEFSSFCISFLVLFQLCSVSSCPHSASIHHIDYIEACNGSDILLTFTFNVTNGLTCGNGMYKIYIYSHETKEVDELTQSPPPVYNNLTGVCTSYLIISNVTFQKYHGKLLQIRMYPTNPVQCSNNFTAIIGTDPPDPVNISSIESVVNCTGVYLYWTPPVTPKKCDILSYDIIVQWNDTVVTTKEPYDIIWNDTVVTTKEPFHYWVAAELPSNEVLTVGIKAFNGNGPSQETSIDIITAVEPVVNIVNHTVIIVSSQAQLIVNAELDSDCCPFSSPNLLHICTMCNHDTSPFYSCVNLTIYNDAMVTFNITLSLDLLQCVSTLTWSNLHSSHNSYINDTFSTSPVHSVFIPTSSSTGYFRINCTLLPGGIGCVIKVFNSDFFIFMEVLTLNDTVIVSDDDYLIVSKTTTHQLTASGAYTVYVYSLKDSDSVGNVVITSRVIEVILPSPSPSPSLVSTSSPSHTPSPPPSPLPSQSVTSPTCFTNCSDSNYIYIIIGVTVGALLIVGGVVCVVIFCVCYIATKGKHSRNLRTRKSEQGTTQKYTPSTLDETAHPNGTDPNSQDPLIRNTSHSEAGDEDDPHPDVPHDANPIYSTAEQASDLNDPVPVIERNMTIGSDNRIGSNYEVQTATTTHEHTPTTQATSVVITRGESGPNLDVSKSRCIIL